MNNLTIKKKHLFLSVFLLGFLSVYFTSCKEKNTVHKTDNNSTLLTGSWVFTLTPDVSIQDTTTIKGIKGTDEPEYSSEFEEVYLYANANGDVTGDSGPFRFEGFRAGDSVILHVYNPQDGFLEPSVTTNNMVRVSTMRLKIDDKGFLNGKGVYDPNPDYEGAENESYFVEGKKRSDITPPHAGQKEAGSNILHTLCNIDASITSFLISRLSDNLFRPIGNCYLEKDGGGYYVYGHYGPGSLLPIYTQTVYYPYEWSWCKVRKYNFNIKMQGNIEAVEALKWIVKHQAPTNNFSVNLGFETADLLNDAIDDFYNKFGGFAISFGFSTRTHNLSIYVNHEHGSREDALNHYLITSIASAMRPNVNKIYYFSGKSIHDSWYLRRSDFGVCNTPLLFVYVLGTNEVYYN